MGRAEQTNERPVGGKEKTEKRISGDELKGSGAMNTNKRNGAPRGERQFFSMKKRFSAGGGAFSEDITVSPHLGEAPGLE